MNEIPANPVNALQAQPEVQERRDPMRPSTPLAADSVKLSDLAQRVKDAANSPEDPARAAKVEGLRQAAAQGSYSPDIEALARKLLGQ